MNQVFNGQIKRDLRSRYIEGVRSVTQRMSNCDLLLWIMGRYALHVLFVEINELLLYLTCYG